MSLLFRQAFVFIIILVLVFRIHFPVSQLKLFSSMALNCFRVYGKLWKWGSLFLRICFDGFVRFHLSTIIVPADKRAYFTESPNLSGTTPGSVICAISCKAHIIKRRLFNSHHTNLETGIYQTLNNRLLSYSKYMTK